MFMYPTNEDIFPTCSRCSYTCSTSRCTSGWFSGSLFMMCPFSVRSLYIPLSHTSTQEKGGYYYGFQYMVGTHHQPDRDCRRVLFRETGVQSVHLYVWQAILALQFDQEALATQAQLELMCSLLRPFNGVQALLQVLNCVLCPLQIFEQVDDPFMAHIECYHQLLHFR